MKLDKTVNYAIGNIYTYQADSQLWRVCYADDNKPIGYATTRDYAVIIANTAYRRDSEKKPRHETVFERVGKTDNGVVWFQRLLVANDLVVLGVTVYDVPYQRPTPLPEFVGLDADFIIHAGFDPRVGLDWNAMAGGVK